MRPGTPDVPKKTDRHTPGLIREREGTAGNIVLDWLLMVFKPRKFRSMYCSNCGKKIPDGNKYCPYCGNPAPEEVRTAKIPEQSRPAVTPAPAAKRPGKPVIAAVIAGAVLVVTLSVVLASAVIGSIRGNRKETPRAGKSGRDAAVEIEPLRDISEGSAIYQEAYLDMLANLDVVIASYWENGDEIDRMFDSMRGTTEQFHDALRQLDPEIYDVLSDTAAEEGGHNALDSHLIKKGVDAYFSDSEIGRELRAAGETLFLGIMKSLWRYGEDSMRQDLLVALSVDGKYALMRTHGTVADLLEQIRDDSGYHMASTALKAYYDELFEYYGWNITEEMNIVFNGRDGAEEIQEKWDRLNGRLHALEDGMALWDRDMERWTDAFYNDLGLAKENVSGAERVYCVVDRDERLCCFFVEEGLSGFRIHADGRFSYRREGETVFCDHDGIVVWRGDGTFSFSRCGNAFRVTERNDFQNGSYQVVELIRPDGSTIEICRGYDVGVYDCKRAAPLDGYRNDGWNTGTVGGSDYWAVEYRTLGDWTEVNAVVNARTGRMMDRRAFDEWYGEEQDRENARETVPINDWYALNDRTWDLCDREGNPVKNLGDGQGVASMFWSAESGRYWVRSNTGYFYVLDGSLDTVAGPMQLPGDFNAFTPYGVLMREEGENRLYDEAGNLLYAYPGTTLWGFLGGVTKSPWGYLDVDSRQHDMSYNLNTKEQMFLTLPGTGKDE